MARKTLELAEHFGEAPPLFMETSHSGSMKTREVVAIIPMQVVDYCKLGKPYLPKEDVHLGEYRRGPKMALCENDCPANSECRHTAKAKQGSPEPRFILDSFHAIIAAYVVAKLAVG